MRLLNTIAMILTLMANVIYGADINTAQVDYSLSEFSFSHSGSSTDEIYSFEVHREGDRLLIDLDLYCVYQNADIELSAHECAALEKLVDDYDLMKWDGFDGRDDYVLDGSSFSLTVKLRDGTGAHAYGDNSFPEGYAQAKAAIDEFLRGVLDNRDIDPWAQ